MAARTTNSLETILTYENTDFGQWSVEWSTTHIPGMDNASGRSHNREVGRRRLRIASLVLGGLLTMHCRVAASALTGGLFVFMLFMIISVGSLANPMRHFELYLGQWSISGPGRAFRIIPMFDGIGIAICINAIVRAINCCFIAAIAAMYVVHSVSDTKLPFTYCRDYNLKSYEPIMKEVKILRIPQSNNSEEKKVEEHDKESAFAKMVPTTVGLTPYAWRNLTSKEIKRSRQRYSDFDPIPTCNENYTGKFPSLYTAPAYNFFYVEIVHYRDDHNMKKINVSLVACNILIWSTIWMIMVSERFRYGKLIWNNIYMWFIIIPLIWTVLLSTAAICSLRDIKKSITLFRIGAKELLATIADALEGALYIHSAGVGTEIINGKGLNRYASGHIDPHLNRNNIWHSILLMVALGLHCIGASLCALVDSTHLKTSRADYVGESTLWIMPLYSKCTSLGNYSHLMTTLIFGGLVFSYMTVAFILLKSALHTIFEYRVKLVFVEQIIVGVLIVACMGLSLPFASNGGIALLEIVDSMMAGIATASVCLLELFGLLYVYRAHDFLSDMNISQEDTMWPSRLEWQWRMLPFITLLTVFAKGLKLAQSELPRSFVYVALAPLLSVAVAVPLRALHNALVFLRPTPRHGT